MKTCNQMRCNPNQHQIEPWNILLLKWYAIHPKYPGHNGIIFNLLKSGRIPSVGPFSTMECEQHRIQCIKANSYSLGQCWLIVSRASGIQLIAILQKMVDIWNENVILPEPISPKSHETIWSHQGNTLTHCGPDKMAAIFHATFSNIFSWIKLYKFRIWFHWSLFLRVKFTKFKHRFSRNKPLSEPMMVSFLMQLCITRPQWVKSEK